MFRLLGKIFSAFSPASKDKILESQSRINEAEVAGGPPSILRLWRSFLGWIMALLLVWEMAGRTVILTYWPETKLPPSMLADVKVLLLGMLGLGI